MLHLWWRRLSVVVLFLIVAACSGSGGCTSCAGCGTTPLPGGFPKAEAITNAASVRVTRTGLDFLGTNLGTIAGKALGSSGGIIHFNVPHSTTTITLINIEICKNPSSTQCIADIDLGNAKLHLDAADYTSVAGEPALRISGTIPVKVDDIPVNTSLGNMEIGIGNGGCTSGVPNVTYADIPVEVILPLISETIAPRDGYTKVDTKNAVINATIGSSVVQLCGGFLSTILNLFKSYIVGQITGPLQTALKNQLDTQLCTKPNAMVTPPCPTGSQPDSGNTKCVYTSDTTTCVPMELGTDGHIDLSGLLAKISPGTSGGLDFVFASGGNMMPTTAPGTTAPPDGNGNAPNGMTLGMLGGALPMPQSGCVPLYNNQVPTGIPIPDEMLGNTVTPWPMGDNGPNLGIALSGRFLNFAMGSVYNSGLLCLGISTDQFAQLNSGTLSLLIPSMKTLTFEEKPGSVAIITRPQQPPVIKIGTGKDIKTDPLLLITLKSFAIDFYVWYVDRFVRAFTFTGDLSIPVNLSTAKDPNTNPDGGILPVLGDIAVGPGATVTNNDLITDNPTTVAAAIGPLFGGIAGKAFGSLKPISLASSLSKYGLAMTIPDGGIRKLTKDTDDYLAIFADLGLSGMATGPGAGEADVQAKLVSKTVHPEAMSLSTADRAKLPTLTMAFSSSLDNGAHFVEYSYATDDGTRSAWAQGRDVTIQNDSLFLQGKHVLRVWAREVGKPTTESSVPAEVPFTIDVLAPMVQLDAQEGNVAVRAWDIVSPQETLTMRYQTVDAVGKPGEWTPWAPIAAIPASAASNINVEVKDEEGNVASQSQGLIRGKNDNPSAGGACGCTTPGTEARGGWLWSAPLIAGLFAFGWRRRKASPPALSLAGEGAKAKKEAA